MPLSEDSKQQNIECLGKTTDSISVAETLASVREKVRSKRNTPQVDEIPFLNVPKTITFRLSLILLHVDEV